MSRDAVDDSGVAGVQGGLEGSFKFRLVGGPVAGDVIGLRQLDEVGAPVQGGLGVARSSQVRCCHWRTMPRELLLKMR